MILKRNFFFYLLPSILASLIGFITVPLSTYFLEPKDFGVYAILAAIVIPLSALASTGTSWVISSHYFQVPEAERKILTFNILFLDLCSKFMWILVFWLLAPLILPLIVKDFLPEYIFFFRLVLVSTLLSSFTASATYFLVMQKRAAAHALVEIAGPVTALVALALCFFTFQLKTESLFFAPLAAEILSLIISLCVLYRSMDFVFQKKWLSAVMRVGLPSIPYDIVGLIYNAADKYFIQRWINLSSLGIFSHSTSYRGIFNLGFKAFNRTYAPNALEIFSAHASPAGLRTPLKRWFGLIGIVGTFVALFSFEVVSMLTHGKFIAAASLVPLWFLLVVLATYGTTYMQFLLAQKKSTYLIVSGTLISAISIGIVGFSIFYFGLLGAVVGTLISNLCIQLSYVIYARKIGAPSMGELDFFVITLLLLCIHLLNQYFHLDLGARIIAFFLFSGIITIYSGLLGVLKEYCKKMVSYVTHAT